MQVDKMLTSMSDCAAQGLAEQLLPYLRRNHPGLLMPGTMVSQWLVDLMDSSFFGQVMGKHFYTHLPNAGHGREREIALALASKETNFARFLDARI